MDTPITKPSLVLYHSNCADGLVSAWVMHRTNMNLEYIAMSYQSELPPIEIFKDRQIYMVDFCLEYEKLLAVAKVAKAITILDHHQTSEEMLTKKPLPENVTCSFRKNQSGASIAWGYFHGINPPKLVSYVEDRDLWRFKLPNSKDIQPVISIACGNFETKQFSVLTALSQLLETNFERVVSDGQAMLQAQQAEVERIASKAFWIEIDEYRVLCSTTRSYVSEVCNYMLVQHPEMKFTANYFDKDLETRIVSLRSLPDRNFDVAKLAERFGGGGHPTAAGFTIKVVKPLIQSKKS